MLSLVLVLFKFYFPFFGVFIFEFVKFYFVRRSLFEGKMRYCCWDFFFFLFWRERVFTKMGILLVLFAHF